MASYKLKDDFVNGVLPNTNGKPKTQKPFTNCWSINIRLLCIQKI
jgi:hypothetical protein